MAMSRYSGKLLESPETDCPSEVAKKQLLNQIKGIFKIFNRTKVIRYICQITA